MLPKRKNIFLRLLNFLVAIITVAGGLSLILGYMASWISPESVWWISFLGLGLNLLILLNIILLFYWLMQFSFWAIIPSLALIIGVAYIGDFIQLSIFKHYRDDNSNNGAQVTIATYNVHNFNSLPSGIVSHNIVDSIGDFFTLSQPDIIFMQEYGYNHHRDSSVFAESFAKWPHQTSLITGEYDNGLKIGINIRSTYPLRNVQRFYFEHSSNAFMSADIIVNRDTIRLFNCHLQTTDFNQVQPHGIRSLVESNNSEEAVKSVAKAFKRNFIKRAAQADSLAKLIAESPYPVIVAGDFNDTPNSYAVSTVKKNLKDSFRTAGSGYEYTYIPIMRLWRIDYILYSPEALQAQTHYSPNVKWSDHKPVISRINILPTKTSK